MEDDFETMSYYGNKSHIAEIENVLSERIGVYENKSQFINTAVTHLLKLENQLKNLKGPDYFDLRLKLLRLESEDNGQ